MIAPALKTIDQCCDQFLPCEIAAAEGKRRSLQCCQHLFAKGVMSVWVKAESVAAQQCFKQMVLARLCEEVVEVSGFGDGNQAHASSSELEVGFLQILVEAVEAQGLKGLALHPVIVAVASQFQGKTDEVFASITIQQQHLVGADHQ